MKKVAVWLTAMALVIALSTAALAEAIVLPELVVKYCKTNGAKVYKKQSTKTKTYKELKRGDEVLIEQMSEDEKWYGILVEVKDGQTIGWVESKYLVDYRPCIHDWSDWAVTKKATCKEKGEKSRSCSKCGRTQTKEIDKTKHSYSKWKVTKKPTCTKEGEQERTCKVCGKKQTKAVEKVEHTYSKWKVTKKPTCTKEGTKVRTCTVCKKEQKKAIEKVEHTYGDWKVTKEPTCTAEGAKVRTCTVCGKEQKKAIEMLPHSFGEWVVTTEATDHSAGERTKTCQSCGLVQSETFDPEGTLRRGSRGDEVRAFQKLLADQHYLNGGVDGVFGGGTERALMEFQKDQGLNPDGVAWPQTLQRLNHEFGAWKIVVPATRFADGERTRICTTCGYEERETYSAGISFERRQRGEDVKAVQMMLNVLGYSAGSADGIYGPKLDNAFGAFAAANGLTAEPGRLRPGDVDAIVNAWIAVQPPESWMGQGNKESPVNLILTVTPDSEAEAGEGLRAYNWTLTNFGTEKCVFNALLLGFGDSHDFRADNLVMAVDSAELEPEGANTLSGSLTVADDWAGGANWLSFCAVGTAGTTGVKWTSNPIFYDLSA